ncbi:S26 family signal peptidase [Pectinatus frisingensis]|uniref:S26 family signal peptidase n=1 Tax=Pectinatus frisingensis TaxID=865 RepID=UPI0018C4517F|nr:S26 family signal peptidase [Pectinatus frisingensis]
MTNIKKNKCIISILCVIGVAFFVFNSNFEKVKVQIPFLYFNTSASLPIGIYLQVPCKIRRGDIVIYNPLEMTKELAFSRKWIKEKNEFFIKRIGALPGDHYSINNLQFSIKGNYIGPVSLTDTAGRPLPQLKGDYVVPNGEFLPSTTNTHSFDGRYTGTVPIKNIKAKVIPLLTW